VFTLQQLYANGKIVSSYVAEDFIYNFVSSRSIFNLLYFLVLADVYYPNYYYSPFGCDF